MRGSELSTKLEQWVAQKGSFQERQAAIKRKYRPVGTANHGFGRDSCVASAAHRIAAKASRHLTSAMGFAGRVRQANALSRKFNVSPIDPMSAYFQNGSKGSGDVGPEAGERRSAESTFGSNWSKTCCMNSVVSVVRPLLRKRRVLTAIYRLC